MLTNLRSYDLAVQFYKACKTIRLPYYMKNQLLRAAASVTLNIAEGSAKSSKADQKRFYEISLGSLRETQAVFHMEPNACKDLIPLADRLGANLFCLVRSLER